MHVACAKLMPLSFARSDDQRAVLPIGHGVDLVGRVKNSPILRIRSVFLRLISLFVVAQIPISSNNRCAA